MCDHDRVTMRAVERLSKFVPRGDLSRGVLTLVAGTGMAQLIVILSSPVLTRLYPPSDYGVYSVAMSIVAVLITIACLRYEFAIPLPGSDVTAANVLVLALVTALVMSAISGVVLWLTGPALLAIFGASALAPYVLLIPLGQFGGGAAYALANWAVRTKSFADIAAMRLTQSVSLVAVQIALGLAGAGAPGLLVGDVAGRVSGSGRLARAAWRTHAPAIRSVSRAGIAAAAHRYRRFPILSSPSALLNVLGMQAPLLLLVAFYGTAIGGQYALADRVCSIPLTLVAGAVGQVYLAEAARLAREQPAELRTLFRRTTWSLARVAIGPAVLLALLAPLLAGPLFGGAWSEMGIFVAVLTPMFYVAFVTTATGDTLYVLERQDLQLVREILRLGLLGGAVPVAFALGLSAVGAVALLSVAGCLTYALYGLISWYTIVTRHASAEPSPVTEADVLRDMADWPNS